MYNPEKIIGAINPTVGDLIAELQKLPSDMKVAICGDSYCFLHVESDSSVVCIDNESLDDCYGGAISFDSMNEKFTHPTIYPEGD